MGWVEHNPLGLSRAGVLMVGWGLLLLVAGALSQWAQFPSFELFLAMWGAVTVLGLALQATCHFQDQRANLSVWLAAVALGWVFTLYIMYRETALYSELAPLWLLLLGVAYIDTAFRINTRFFYLAAIHIVGALVLELAGRGVLKVDFLSTYSPFILGVIAGLFLIIGAPFARIRAGS